MEDTLEWKISRVGLFPAKHIVCLADAPFLFSKQCLSRLCFVPRALTWLLYAFYIHHELVLRASQIDHMLERKLCVRENRIWEEGGSVGDVCP